MVPFSRGDLRADEPLVHDVRLGEGYYWVDDDDRLKIALRRRADSAISDMLDQLWAMSIVLDGLPAGRERLYEVQHSAVQMLQTAGGGRMRARSIKGIVVVGSPEGGRLRGRFHVSLLPEQFSVLKGWVPVWTPLVVAGEFTAVLDPTRGQEVLAVTEQDGYARLPHAPNVRRVSPRTTQPAGTAPAN